MSAILRRSALAIFSNSNCIYDHRVRFALTEKAVTVDMFYVDEDDKTLLEINASGSRPTLVDRELVINHSNIILEYLDERFPHPPLFPVYPILRAKVRMMIRQLEIDWYVPAIAIQNNDSVTHNTKLLMDNMAKISPLFKKNKYFMGDDFGIIDCCIAPILWRLPEYNIELNEAIYKPINAYAERIFEKISFQGSLSNEEYKMRNEDDF